MSNRKPALKLALILLIAAVPAALAQDGAGAHTIPHAVFVGDRATLIVPLAGFPGQGDVEVPPGQLPYSPDIDIHRVALERRPGGSRLAVEFAAFAPGVLELPPIEVAGETFAGLTVTIGSVLAPSEIPILSPPAPPLAVPGTALLVYGTIAAIVASLLLVSLISFRGHVWVMVWLAAWRRRRMLSAMLGAERRLRKALAKGADPREVLDALSGEFRGFLAGLTGENCRTMTASEIGRLVGCPHLQDDAPGGEFLGSFFDRCDGARFSGRAIGGDETLAIIDDLRGFLLAMKALNRAAPPAAAAEEPGTDGQEQAA